MQQASSPSQGFSPGHPLYIIPQYFPYLKNSGTAQCSDSQFLLHSCLLTASPVEGSMPMLRASAEERKRERRRKMAEQPVTKVKALGESFGLGATFDNVFLSEEDDFTFSLRREIW